MDVIATKDLPTLKAKKGQTLWVSPLRARELVRAGLARFVDGDPLAPAPQVTEPPAPLAGSPTGAADAASSSGPAPAPSERRSRSRKAKPAS